VARAARLYRAAGLSPTQYESAGRRRDSAISGEGSVWLRRALIDLGMGLWHSDPAANATHSTRRTPQPTRNQRDTSPWPPTVLDRTHSQLREFHVHGI
jgi:transposase